MAEVIPHAPSTLDQHSMHPEFYEIFQCSLDIYSVSGICYSHANITFLAIPAYHLYYYEQFSFIF